jgi:hypothetical protein
MYVNFDDLAANRIVQHLHARPPLRGCLALWGYDLSEPTGWIGTSPRFYRTSGTNCVINWRFDDVPAMMSSRRMCCSGRKGEVGEGLLVPPEQVGRPVVADLPHPPSSMCEHGDNAAGVLLADGWWRRLIRQLTPTRTVRQAIRAEFGLESISGGTAPR